MNGRQNIIWIIIFTILLVGCWDERLLRKHSLILAIGYDLEGDDIILKTVSLPKESGGKLEQIEPGNQSEVITTSGNTARDTDDELDRILPQKFDRSKARTVLLGKELATDGIFSTLDSLYRDLRSPLNARVAIIDGTAREALNINRDYSFLISEFYFDFLQGAEESGLIKNENVQSICPLLLSDGKDIVLPYVTIENNGKEARIKGLALFSDDQMTGELNGKESTMFLILSNQLESNTKLNFKIEQDKIENDKNFVDLVFHELKRKQKITTKNEKIKVNIDISLRVEIDEYPADHLNDEKKAKALSKKIEKQMNHLALETIEKMQKANNDSLGIGEKMKAYHHSTWEKIDWDKFYSEIPIETSFNVDIVHHGIIN